MLDRIQQGPSYAPTTNTSHFPKVYDYQRFIYIGDTLLLFRCEEPLALQILPDCISHHLSFLVELIGTVVLQPLEDQRISTLVLIPSVLTKRWGYNCASRVIISLESKRASIDPQIWRKKQVSPPSSIMAYVAGHCVPVRVIENWADPVLHCAGGLSKRLYLYSASPSCHPILAFII